MAITTLPAGAPADRASRDGRRRGHRFKYTQYEGNEFPGLHWTSGPAGTKSYAIIMQDTDLVMRGSPILHWSVVNIPASVDHLPAGMKPEEIPAGSIYGPNYQGAGKPYLGPRTPPGPKHRYHIRSWRSTRRCRLTLRRAMPTDRAAERPCDHDGDGAGAVDPSAPPPRRVHSGASAAAPAAPPDHSAVIWRTISADGAALS
jgi:Raf kinase inhibitor-like YbhB/YbcL family protein